MEKIIEFEKLQGSELNEIKVLLADEATKLLHGDESLDNIHATAKTLFGSGGGDLDSLTKIQLEASDFVAKDDGSETVGVVEMLVKAGFAASKSEAKRLIKAGGAKVNDEKIDDEMKRIGKDAFDSSGRLKLSSGKKKHVVVVLP